MKKKRIQYCTRHLPTPNVFNLAVNPGVSLLKLYKEGYYSYEELLDAKINDKQRQTIEFYLYDKEDYIDKESIKEFLDSLTYPLYYLDFETYQLPIPLFDRVMERQNIKNFQEYQELIQEENQLYNQLKIFL